jgi:phage I-like protein
MPVREGVEIARTGTHPLSTGMHTFTKEQLAAALANAATQKPVIGIGHVDPRFNIPGQDGDPAFGRVTNLRLAEDGDLLLGDFDDMPEWLDNGLERAYPRRSIEGHVAGDDLRISSVKLLGTTLPGIKGLADLPAVIAASSIDTNHDPEQVGKLLTKLLMAATNVDDVREAFIGTHPSNGENDWWSVREVQIDPNQLIVCHYSGGADTLYRVDWTAEDDSFTFGDLIEVAVQYVDVVAASSSDPTVVYREPVIRPAPTPEREESEVDAKVLREQLGLAEDASDDDVTAKLAALNARPESTDGLLTPEQVEEQKQEAVAAAIAAKSDDDETVKLDKQTFEDLKASAEAGKAAHTTLEHGKRDTFIAAAVEKGKFPPSRVEHYTKRYDSDPEGTRAEIEALAEGVVPVQEIGASTTEVDTDAPQTTGWFPQLAEKEEVA